MTEEYKMTLRRRAEILLFLLTGLVMLGVAASLIVGWQRHAATLSKGDLLPEVSGQTLTGDRISAEDFRGKALLVNVFTSWCGNCRMELKRLSDLHKRYADGGFEVLAISVDGDPADARRAVADTGLKCPVIFSGEGHDDPNVLRLGATMLPRSILVGRDGRIVDPHTDTYRLERTLDRLLAAHE